MIFEWWQSEIWNEILSWYFKLLLFVSIARNFLNVKAKVSVFFTILLVDRPHHQYYNTNINYDSRGSKSNWWVSEKRSAVTLGRAGYIDDEHIVYNSTTYRIPKVEPARGGEHNSGATPRFCLVVVTCKISKRKTFTPLCFTWQRAPRGETFPSVPQLK